MLNNNYVLDLPEIHSGILETTMEVKKNVSTFCSIYQSFESFDAKKCNFSGFFLTMKKWYIDISFLHNIYTYLKNNFQFFQVENVYNNIDNTVNLTKSLLRTSFLLGKILLYFYYNCSYSSKYCNVQTIYFLELLVI